MKKAVEGKEGKEESEGAAGREGGKYALCVFSLEEIEL